MLLKDKVAIITGGGSGIGRATALLFARHGASVAVLDRTRTSSDSVVAELERPGSHFAVVADVSRGDQVEAAFASIDAALGSVDILVNAAGIRGTRSVLDVSDEDWHTVIETNLSGTFYCCRQAGRRMAEAGKGSIVNISSSGGLVGLQSRAAYNASKAGVLGLTRSLALDLGPAGIRANAVCPGLIRTPLNEEFFADTAWVEGLRGAIPLGGAGTPADVAQASLFLASDAAAYITGAALEVDGGLVATRSLGSASSSFVAERPAT